MFSRLKSSKAFYAAIGGILIAVGMALKAEIEWDQALRVCFEAILVIFLRDGIAKGK